ncbi:MAG: Sua5/YciO/YrdC/YwlC family protein [Candidatus Gracilibacteria bacterium]|nr:Sua5/YciO/YrdC/YwlC family protein [Candidatus Gracilibacteria bacterium]
MIYILPTDTCYGIACPIHDLKAYDGIYKIKKRSLDKPLAILVPDFKWLADNTDLTAEQINFLENYNRPFTVLTDCNSLRIWINYIDDENNEFVNRDIYEKFAFRVANNSIQKRLLKENGPMFMTSANISNNPEIYHKSEIKEQFAYYLEKGTIQFVGENMGNPEKNKPSDIFEFIGDSLDINYLRKN